MFFRVLSAMLTADAIDRHLRTKQPRYWYLQAPQNAQADIAPVTVELLSGGAVAPAQGWDPQAPERP